MTLFEPRGPSAPDSAVEVILKQQATREGLAAVAFTCQWLPRILFLPFGGVLVDRLGSQHSYLAFESARASYQVVLHTAEVAQALITRWVGNVFVRYLQNEMNPPPGGLAEVARIKRLEPQEVAARTNQNARDFFGI